MTGHDRLRPIARRLHPALLFAVALAALFAARPGSAQVGGFGGDDGFGLDLTAPRVMATVQPVAVAPGGTVDVPVQLVIEETWHIQAGAGSGEETSGFVSTDVTLTLPDGWTAGTPLWPPSKEYVLGEGIDFRGYEGTVTVLVPVTAPADATEGDVPLSAKIDFQACDDAFCDEPTSTTVRGSIAVRADAGGAAGGGPDFSGDRRLVAELVWYEGGVVPGVPASLGVVLHTAPGWHIQAGAGSGDVKDGFIPTEITLELPDGWSQSGDILWPEATPEGWYGGSVVAIVTVDAPEDAAVGTLPISATVGYQACDDAICEMPTDLTVEGTVTVLDAAAAESIEPLDAATASMFARTFQHARTASASADDGDDDEADEDAAGGFDVTKAKWWIALLFVGLSMGWMAARSFGVSERWGVRLMTIVIATLVTWGSFAFVRGITAESDIPWQQYEPVAFQQAVDAGDTVLLKFTAEWCAVCQVNKRIIEASDVATETLSADGVSTFEVDFTSENPDGDAKKDELGGGGIPILAVYSPDRSEPVVMRGPLADASPVVQAIRGENVATAVDDDSWEFDVLGWFTFSVPKDATLIIMGLAFIAGFLMNFTPCVLPVIPIKILSLQAHAKEPAKCLLLGLVFSAGIVVLYAVLGLLMAGLVGGIDKLDWGEHFTKWWLNGLIAVIIGAMGIGMMGVFTIRLPQFLYMFNPTSDSTSGSFFMGVFTAILSTPCTGPLLGATVAWTATQPPSVALTTLVVMGCGMAFPYVVLTAFPSLLKKMPKTGPGSELLKQVMGMLMIAVAVWFGGTAWAALTG